MPFIMQISGYSNSGKTTLLTHIIRRLSSEGLRVAVIKHDGGHDFELDQTGKDTWQFKEAGAPLVAIQSKTKTAWLDYSPVELPEIINRISTGNPDIIFIEGFKYADYPKIVLIRREEDKELLHKLTQIIAVASWLPMEDNSRPVFSIHDHEKISELIIDRYRLSFL